MARLQWDIEEDRFYETGVDRGVLYPRAADGSYPKGFVWNGLTGITESPSGAETTPLWADNIKYLSLISAEEFGGTIEAYTYPDEFMPCDGTLPITEGAYIGQQSRQSFGLSYRTVLGNAIKLNEFGYKIHLIYGATASVSERPYATINDSPEAITFSWDFTTVPTPVKGFRPTSTVTIDSTKIDPDKLANLENVLYGTRFEDPRLPLPDEVAEILQTTLISLDLRGSVYTPIGLMQNKAIQLERRVTFTGATMEKFTAIRYGLSYYNRVEYWIIDTHQPGANVVIIAGVHGNELSGPAALLDIVSNFEFTRGRYLLIPEANRLAVELNDRYPGRRSPNTCYFTNTTNYSGYSDLNRAFPGDPDGEITDQIAATITWIIDRFFESTKQDHERIFIDMHEAMDPRAPGNINVEYEHLGNTILDPRVTLGDRDTRNRNRAATFAAIEAINQSGLVTWDFTHSITGYDADNGVSIVAFAQRYPTLACFLFETIRHECVMQKIPQVQPIELRAKQNKFLLNFIVDYYHDYMDSRGRAFAPAMTFAFKNDNDKLEDDPIKIDSELE